MVGDRFDDIDLGFGLERAILDAVEIEPLLPECIRWRGLGTHTDAALPDLAPDRRDRPERRERQPLPERQGRQDRSDRRDRDFWSENARVSQPDNRLLPLHRKFRQTANSRQATALALAADELNEPALQETLPRPLRLLRQPEPIEAIAPLPDEPPVLFRWRECLHKVISARGPETVAQDWCRPLEEGQRPPAQKRNGEDSGKSSMRDYFAVEDSEGARFWLFREGRYSAASSTLPRWFLHGVFG